MGGEGEGGAEVGQRQRGCTRYNPVETCTYLLLKQSVLFINWYHDISDGTDLTFKSPFMSFTETDRKQSVDTSSLAILGLDVNEIKM